MGISFKKVFKPFKAAQSVITSGGINLLGGGPEGGDDGGANAAAEEERKSELRRRIDAFYGIGSPEAAQALEAENTKLANATRSYYTDQLGQKYQDAERQTRFRLARSGLLGGSEDVNQQGKIKEDRNLGATRVDDSVRRAISSLSAQREQERLSAIGLVNAGAGDSAVSAAQAGLRNSLDNVSSQQKQALFTDLFSGGADAIATQNLADRESALLGRYRNQLNSFFPSGGSSSSGRVTPSS